MWTFDAVVSTTSLQALLIGRMPVPWISPPCGNIPGAGRGRKANRFSISISSPVLLVLLVCHLPRLIALDARDDLPNGLRHRDEVRSPRCESQVCMGPISLLRPVEVVWNYIGALTVLQDQTPQPKQIQISSAAPGQKELQRSPVQDE